MTKQYIFWENQKNIICLLGPYLSPQQRPGQLADYIDVLWHVSCRVQSTVKSEVYPKMAILMDKK